MSNNEKLLFVRALLKIQTYRIHAVTLSGRCGSIIKYMAEVRTALSAHDLRAMYAAGIIRDLAHRARQRLIERWPARAGIELGIGREQRITARRTTVYTFFIRMKELPGKRRLGPLLAQNNDTGTKNCCRC